MTFAAVGSITPAVTCAYPVPVIDVVVTRFCKEAGRSDGVKYLNPGGAVAVMGAPVVKGTMKIVELFPGV